MTSRLLALAENGGNPMIIRYLISILVFVAFDAVWLGVVATRFYRDHIGHLMMEQAKLVPALLFYLIFLAGLNLFVLAPHKDSSYATIAQYGAAFGLVTYATFDLTSQAVFIDFPTIVVVVDLCWGAFLSMSIALTTTWILRRMNKHVSS